MKTMTCRELGGACDKVFRADSFEEMARLSRSHGEEMFRAGDKAHLDAMEAMKTLMEEEGAMEAWMAEKKARFDALPDS